MNIPTDAACGIDYAALLLDQQRREQDLARYYRYFGPESPAGYARACVLGEVRHLLIALDNPTRYDVAAHLNQLREAMTSFDQALNVVEGGTR